MIEKMRHIILGFALLVGLSTVAYAVSPAMSSAVPCGVGYQYFNSSGQVVGMRTWQPLKTCGCLYVEWGTTTGNYETFDSAC